ncbi:energy-coupled thiamine transporter ThiT [Lentilactobacillus sp. Marseille-Q4993]|uniref:energy-coupled thiamine transporter ThiT n=1 Tax=Lentilactobacillus sp. Marseille-Q4993 TaxID=3039492 RepID=UPI0024BC37FC|nr:energy-coupled thiamine transporter ThiT [Lentilactobacillus sp. Marseille-Q4993]
MNKQSLQLSVLTEGAAIVAMATALSFLPLSTPHGAIAIQLGAIPLIMFSLRRGGKAGLIAGFVFGLVQIVDGVAFRGFLSVAQLILEFPVASTMLGIGGLFANKIVIVTESKLKIDLFELSLAAVIATVAAWSCHYIAGAVVLREYMPKGVNPYIYSLAFNGTSALLNSVVAVIVLIMIALMAPQLFVVTNATKKRI